MGLRITGIIGALAMIFPASAGTLVDEIAEFERSHKALLIFVFSFLALLIFAVFFMANRKTKRRMHTLEELRRLFTKELSRFGLSQEEDGLLSKLSCDASGCPSPLLFHSNSMFESHLHRLIEDRLSHGINSDQQNRENDILSALRRKLEYHQLPSGYPLISSRNMEVGQGGAIFGKSHLTALLADVKVSEKDEFGYTLHFNDPENKFFFVPDVPLRFVFAHTDDATYSVPLRVQDASRKGRIRSLHSLEMHREQNRSFQRTETHLIVHIRVVESKGNTKLPVPSLEGKISELSGGGCRVIAPEGLHVGDLISVRFSLPFARKNTVEVLARVKEISSPPSSGIGGGAVHHLQFVNISSEMAKSIGVYVSEHLREAKGI